MKFPEPIDVKSLAAQFNAKVIGDDSLQATGINEIHKVEPGDITFSDVKKYFDRSLQSAATVIILNEEAVCPSGKVILVVDDPFTVYDTIVRRYRHFRPITESISESAQIHLLLSLSPE